MIRSLLISGTALLCLAALAVPGAAQAQSNRMYLAGYLGLNVFNDMHFADSASGRSGDFQIDNTNSFAGAMGLRLSNHLRMEGEWSYRQAGIKNADVAGTGALNLSGSMKSSTLFANMYYDLDIDGTIEPYIGGGLGYGWHTLRVGDGTSTITSMSSEDSTFMWNAAVGATYRTSPTLAWTAGYRYVDSLDLELSSYDVDYGTHEFRLGMEWDLPIR